MTFVSDDAALVALLASTVTPYGYGYLIWEDRMWNDRL